MVKLFHKAALAPYCLHAIRQNKSANRWSYLRIFSKIYNKGLICFTGLVAVICLFSCTSQVEQIPTKSGLKRTAFDTVINDSGVRLFVIKNSTGAEVCITNYGGRIVSLWVPDRVGNFRDVVLGFDNITDYTAKASSFGATIGRFANRIANGKFLLDSDSVHLDINSGAHTIHGGSMGWQNQVYSVHQSSDSSLVLTYTSTDGEAGFPGEVMATVTYTLGYDNSLSIAYSATTDKKTVINMTNHSFFNLNGNPETGILDHELYVSADYFTPLTEGLITTGDVLELTASPFDFRKPTLIGDAFKKTGYEDQLRFVNGIDHNLVLNNAGDTSHLAAQLYAPQSGIVMDVYTDEPGLQVYTGNMLDGSRIGKKGISYNKQAAICLESQHFPDSPNKPHWPSTVLDPGETYRSLCVYRFSIKK